MHKNTHQEEGRLHERGHGGVVEEGHGVVHARGVLLRAEQDTADGGVRVLGRVEQRLFLVRMGWLVGWLVGGHGNRCCVG